MNGRQHNNGNTTQHNATKEIPRRLRASASAALKTNMWAVTPAFKLSAVVSYSTR